MYQMSDRELNDLKQLILSVEKNLDAKLDDVIFEVRKDHEPRIKTLETSIIPPDDVARMKDIVEAFGNWRFLFKFFAIMGGVISFFVTAVYVIVKTIKLL
jgi:hypothetical protein